MIGDYNNYVYELSRAWLPVFEGEADPAPPTPTEPVAAEVPAPEVSKAIFNDEQQKELNRILAAEKKKHQAVTQRALEEATALKRKATLTAKENQEYDARIEQLRTQLLTKEEQAKLAARKTQELHATEKRTLTEERDYWRTEFTDSTIQRSLTDAAAANNAFSPKQIVAILGPSTQLSEVLDSEGKPTGKREPKVRYHTRDKEGKPVTLDLTPADAIKRMKDEDEYQNLFRGEGTGGAGFRSKPGGRKPNISTMAKDPAAWRKARKDGTIRFQ